MLAKGAIKTAQQVPGVAPMVAKAAQSLPGVGGAAGTVGKGVKSVKYMRKAVCQFGASSLIWVIAGYAVNGVLAVGAATLGRALYENSPSLGQANA